MTAPSGWAQAFGAALFAAALIVAAPVGAQRVVVGACTALGTGACTPSTTGPAPDPPQVSGPCSQWAATAFAVGWPVDQWPTISRAMWCEPRCDPAARNRSGAAGLMQVMPMWWHGRDPTDPATNLTMAVEVWHAQGWRAWSCY